MGDDDLFREPGELRGRFRYFYTSVETCSRLLRNMQDAQYWPNGIQNSVCDHIMHQCDF